MSQTQKEIMAGGEWEQLIIFWGLSSNGQLQHITHTEITEDV